ncbi:hypothetical protein [Paragemmobacter straminiformis]|uniref:SatD family (SatD) n=1 Tax=Paragemmobacter straminiformis TaxID=2045119 RepID=A0A842I7D6_9RHOB|nr:hypothetical protein [Gemmobacter straminiformis]MBC2835287.1 hypothetical protein [Gemmobacter straminiformis]
MKHFAVLTGDIIASTQAPDRLAAAMGLLGDVAADLARLSPVAPRLTRFRGDGWQCVTPAPLALRAALLVAARLRAGDARLETRIAIGIGAIDQTGTRDLSDAAGAAFTASGRALDHMARGRVWAIAGQIAPWHEALVALGEWHSARWSREQAEAMALALTAPDMTQSQAASRLGVTRQAWQARLSGAGWSAWRPALFAFESAFDV